MNDYHLRNLKTGEVIILHMDDEEYYSYMDDDMVIHINGRKYERVFPQRKEMGKKRAWARPLVSVSAGCQPGEVDEFNKKAKEDGFTGVSFNKEGDAVFTTRGQRAEYLDHIGMCDRSGTYGDQRKSRR